MSVGGEDIRPLRDVQSLLIPESHEFIRGSMSIVYSKGNAQERETSDRRKSLPHIERYGFNMLEVSVRRSINSDGAHRHGKEIIITNY